jgi:hypothetical protein
MESKHTLSQVLDWSEGPESGRSPHDQKLTGDAVIRLRLQDSGRLEHFPAPTWRGVPATDPSGDPVTMVSLVAISVRLTGNVGLAQIEGRVASQSLGLILFPGDVHVAQFKNPREFEGSDALEINVSGDGRLIVELLGSRSSLSSLLTS